MVAPSNDMCERSLRSVWEIVWWCHHQRKNFTTSMFLHMWHSCLALVEFEALYHIPLAIEREALYHVPLTIECEALHHVSLTI